MKKNNVKRRDFMKLLASGGAATALSSVGQLAVMSEAGAAAPGFSGYKALVCVFFLGGNDGFNMLIPKDATHADYQAIRAALAVQKNDLGLSSISAAMHSGTMGTGAANPYNVNLTQAKAYTKGYYDLSSKGINLGVNGVMPEFAQLIHDNKLSVIANCGNMVAPVTRQEIKDGTAKLALKLPIFLFAHNHQQRELQTGEAHRISALGWAGKIADAWEGVNNNSPIGLNISYSGNNRMLMGDKTSALVLKPGKPVSFRDMRPNTDNYNLERRALFQELIEIGKRASNFERLEASLSERSQTNFEALATAWDNNDINYTSTGPYGEPLFDVPPPAMLGFNDKLSGKFISQMNTVAKMVDMGAKDAFQTGDYKRQIFFVGVGGFDTHANQANGHSKLLREQSLGLWKFQKAMDELGHAEKVTTFSMSDFGRTLSINAGLGTDHAWGSNHFVMGGAGNKTSGTLNGGKMFGTFPDLTPNGPDDYSDKGRMIPTTSQDQINASICEWFGVEQSLISEIFPNLANFEVNQGDTTSAYLKDLFIS